MPKSMSKRSFCLEKMRKHLLSNVSKRGEYA